MAKTTMMLSPKGFAVATAVFWGAGLFIFGLMGMYGWGTPMVQLMGTIYRGFSPTFGGALAGGVWGFVDGLICGYIFALLYNKFA